MEEYGVYYQKELYQILLGGCLLASGGGGTYASAKNLVDNFKKSDFYSKTNDPSFKMVTKDDLDKDAYGVVVAYLGSCVALQGADFPEAAVHAVENIQQCLRKEGKTLRYVVPVETGALSMAVPCLVASKLDLTVVDADGAGRAVPELTMLTYAAADISPDPTVLANRTGYYINLNIGGFDNQGSEAQETAAEAIESLCRPVVGLSEFNQIAGIAIWVMNYTEMDKALQITGTVSRALEAGKQVPKKDNNADTMIDYLKNRFHLKVYKMFEGKFLEDGCKTAIEGGFDHGTIRIIDKSTGEIFTSLFQNETMLAWNSARNSPIAMAPDSIAFYVDDPQKVYSNGDLLGLDGKLYDHLKDQKVTVIGIAADEVLRKTEYEKISSPLFIKKQEQGALMKSFKKCLLDLGYAGKYKKIEDIWK